MTDTRQALAELLNVIQKCNLNGIDWGGQKVRMLEAMRDAYAAIAKEDRAALSAQPVAGAAPAPEPSAQGEPVAWRYSVELRVLGPSYWALSETKDVPEAQPLYASAPSTPPHAVVEAVPLTHDQVWQDDEVMEWNAVAGQSIYNIMRLVRIVERHHKIGIAPKAAQENP